jgi:hypothetical protein
VGRVLLLSILVVSVLAGCGGGSINNGGGNSPLSIPLVTSIMPLGTSEELPGAHSAFVRC